MLTNNHFDGRNGYQPKWLILHGTAGGSSAQGIASYFQSTEGTANPVSSNYIVDQQGVVVCSVDEANAAYGNGILTTGHDPWWSESINPNDETISIEHVKSDINNAAALTPAQQSASFALIKDICQRNAIPMRAADAQGGITGHYSIDPINRSRCPGTFPWDALWAYLKGNPMTIPQGWLDNGTTLTAPNGVPVVRGFRDYVLAHNWDANNWPLQAEQGRTPLELSNPSLGGGTAQDFRYTTLEWTPAKGVFVAWTGVELQALRAALATATTTSTTPDNSAIITALNIASTTITTLTTDLTAANTAIQQVLSNLKS
jgi:hypothetical protein